MKKILRIIQYLDKEGISLSGFERDAKLGYSYLGKTRDRGQEITQKMLDKIRDNQPTHYYKIFPEEIAEKETLVETPEVDYSKKPKEDFYTLLSRSLSIIESQQEVIKSQQETIQEIVTNKKSIASA